MFSIANLFSRGNSPSQQQQSSNSNSNSSNETTNQSPKIPTLESRCTEVQLTHSRAVVNKILADRSKHDPVSSDGRCIGQPTLLRHFPLPGILGDRFFDVIRTRISSWCKCALDTDSQSNTHSNTPTILNTALHSPFSSLRTAMRGGGADNKALSIDADALLATIALLSWGTIQEKRSFLFEMFDCSGSGRVSQEELEGVLVSGALHPSVGDSGNSYNDGNDNGNASSNDSDVNNSRFRRMETKLSEQAVHIARAMAEDAFMCHAGKGSFGLLEFCRWLDSTPEVEHLLFALLSSNFLRSQAPMVDK
jgi:hypothetical protein